jgi:tetratricopeptide (TPR) repeat protein
MNEKSSKRKLFGQAVIKANIKVREGEMEEALKCYNDFLEQFPNNKKALYAKGMIFYSFNETEKASEIFQAIIDSDSTNYEALYAYGIIKAEYNQHSQAIGYFKRAIKSKPKDELSRIALSTSLLILEKYSSVLSVLNEITFSTERAFVFATKGHAHYGLGEWEEAVKNYRKSLELDPYESEVLFGMGRLSFKAREDKQAQEFLQKAVIQDEDHLLAWKFLHRIYQLREDQRRALVAEKAIKRLESQE